MNELFSMSIYNIQCYMKKKHRKENIFRERTIMNVHQCFIDDKNVYSQRCINCKKLIIKRLL